MFDAFYNDEINYYNSDAYLIYITTFNMVSVIDYYSYKYDYSKI